jgi:hypothetical protein
MTMRLHTGFLATGIWAASLSIAHADPITSGVLTLPRPFGPGTLSLQGTDGTLPFTLDNLVSSSSNISLFGCIPCAPGATTISLDLVSLGTDFSGVVTYGAETYRVGFLSAANGEARIELQGTAVLPPTSTMLGDVFISAPFQAQGSVIPPQPLSGSAPPGFDFTGSGVAIIRLSPRPLALGTADASWQFTSAEYRFGESAVLSPTPEPASFMLLATGLAGIALRHRRKSRLG